MEWGQMKIGSTVGDGRPAGGGSGALRKKQGDGAGRIGAEGWARTRSHETDAVNGH